MRINPRCVSIPNGFATYGRTCDDVYAQLAGRPGCPNVGWSSYVNTATLTKGTHYFEVTTVAANVVRASSSSTFIVADATFASPTSMLITQPSPGAVPL